MFADAGTGFYSCSWAYAGGGYGQRCFARFKHGPKRSEIVGRVEQARGRPHTGPQLRARLACLRSRQLYRTTQVVKRSCWNPHVVKVIKGGHQALHVLNKLVRLPAQRLVMRDHPQQPLLVVGAYKRVKGAKNSH